MNLSQINPNYRNANYVRTDYNQAFKSKQTVTKEIIKETFPKVMAGLAAASAVLSSTILARPLAEAKKYQLSYVPEEYFANKSAEESAIAFKNEQKNSYANYIWDTVKDMPEEDICKYVTKTELINTLKRDQFTESPEIIEKLYNFLGKDVFLAREGKGALNSIEFACSHNKNPEVIETLYNLFGKDAFLAREEEGALNSIELACCHNKNPEVIETLYNLFGKDAFLARESIYDNNSITRACEGNTNPEVIKKLYNLLGKDAFLAREGEYDNASIGMACMRNENPEVIEILYNLFGKDAFLVKVNGYEYNPLEAACLYNKNPEIIKELYNLLGKDTFLENAIWNKCYNYIELACERNKNQIARKELYNFFYDAFFYKFYAQRTCPPSA